MFVTLSNMMGYQAAWNLNASNARLSESVLRLSSGLRVQKPSQGTYEYLRGNQLQSDVNGYKKIQENLAEYKSVFSIAGSAASQISDTLDSMLQIATQASDSGMAESDRVALYNQFSSLRTSLDNIVKSTNYAGGTILNKDGKYNQALNINLNLDRSLVMSTNLNYLDVVDLGAGASPNNIEIRTTSWAGVGGDAVAGNAASDVAAAKENVAEFIGQVTGYENSLQSQMNVNDSVMENYSAAKSALVDVDVAEETAAFAALDVKNQAAIAMLTQANLSHRVLLNLYTFQTS